MVSLLFYLNNQINKNKEKTINNKIQYHYL